MKQYCAARRGKVTAYYTTRDGKKRKATLSFLLPTDLKDYEVFNAVKRQKDPTIFSLDNWEVKK